MKQNRQTLIEQAVARGQSLDWICDQLAADPLEVDQVLAHMDECNEDPNVDIQPCGTHAAFNRHRARKEPPCSRCRYAESAWQAERHRKRKAARRALVA